MNVNFEAIEKAWFKPKNRRYWQNKCFERSCEVKLLKEKINDFEEWLKAQVIDRRYANDVERWSAYKTTLEKIQELKKEME